MRLSHMRMLRRLNQIIPWYTWGWQRQTSRLAPMVLYIWRVEKYKNYSPRVALKVIWQRRCSTCSIVVMIGRCRILRQLSTRIPEMPMLMQCEHTYCVSVDKVMMQDLPAQEPLDSLLEAILIIASLLLNQQYPQLTVQHLLNRTLQIRLVQMGNL